MEFIQDWGEFTKIGDLTELEDLGFINNPLEVKARDEGDWAERVGKCCQVRVVLIWILILLIDSSDLIFYLKIFK